MSNSDAPNGKSAGRDVVLPAADGLELAATLHEAAVDDPLNRTVVINAALGVPHGYYRAFAAFLAAEGFDVLTYDVRGSGGSRPNSLRGYQARMSDWATLDMAGAFAWARQRRPGDKIFAVGHSAGGQMLGLAPNAGELDGFVAVAAISGNPNHWRGLGQLPRRLMMKLLVHVLMPGLPRLLGYFPGARIGFATLPKGVAYQWSNWVRHPDYLFGDPSLDFSGYGEFTAPIIAFSFEDDTYVAGHAHRNVIERFENAAVTWRHMHPHDEGHKAIGHFGFFKEALRDSLWRETADWMAGI